MNGRVPLFMLEESVLEEGGGPSESDLLEEIATQWTHIVSIGLVEEISSRSNSVDRKVSGLTP